MGSQSDRYQLHVDVNQNMFINRKCHKFQFPREFHVFPEINEISSPSLIFNTKRLSLWILIIQTSVLNRHLIISHNCRAI